MLNPRIHTEPSVVDETATPRDIATGDDSPAAIPSVKPQGQIKRCSPEALQEREEKVEARRKHPELVPSMFLWKDFGEIYKGIWHLKVFTSGENYDF